MRLPTALLMRIGVAAIFSTAGAAPDERSPAPLAARLPLTQTYACTLNVWNQETQAGSKDLRLTAFHLTVTAVRQKEAGQNGTCPPAANRFWLDQLTLQYLRNWHPETNGHKEQPQVDWNKLRIRVGADPQGFKPLRQLSPRDTLAYLDLHSEIVMGRNDLLRLGIFHFQPDQPGTYDLHFTLQHRQATTFSAIKRVEFFCPAPAPELTLLHAVSVDTERANYRHLPLVASTFFEAGSDLPNQNATDRSLHSLFLGMVAKRLAGQPLQGDFLVLEDPLAPDDRAIQLQRSKSRAQYLQNRVEQSARALQKQNACAIDWENEAAGAGAMANSGLRLREASPAEREIYLKREHSEVSPEWFAEENRVVPLVLSPAAQQLVFAPVKLAHEFSGDCATFRLSQFDTLLLGSCIRAAELVITDAAGRALTQKIALPELRDLCRPQKMLALRSPKWRAFLKPGRYTASLRLLGACAADLSARNTVTFDVPAPREEIFTFSPYDRVELCYDLDRERVTQIGAEIVHAVREQITLPSPRTLVFITGHSDSLGEHRPDGRGREHNLDLSFRRAKHLAGLLQAALADQARQTGLELLFTRENKVSNGTSVHRPLTAHSLPAGRNGATAQSAGHLEQTAGYLEQMIAEKLRSFNDTPEGLRVPTRRDLESRIATIRERMPLEVIDLQLRDRHHSRALTIVIAGFGVTVPFHRRLEEAPEVVEAYCAMGYKPEEIPQVFFGDDAHPAGRFLNRRAELHVIW